MPTPPCAIIESAQGASSMVLLVVLRIRCSTSTPVPLAAIFTVICFSKPVSGSVGSVASSTPSFDRDVHRPIVRRVGQHAVLGSKPDAMPAARLPCRLARFAQALVKFLEDVLTARKGISHDARADVARDDDFDLAVRDAITVRPALVTGLFNFHGCHNADRKKK